MKYLTSFLITITLLLNVQLSLAQDSLGLHSFTPKGISFEYGYGSYSVVDEYISNEKYSGNLPYYKLGWSKPHEKYVYKLHLDFRYSDEISNYNVSTSIYQFILNQGFLYSIKSFKLFGKDTFVWLGPSTELFFYSNEQNIAVSGFDYAQSFAGLLSLGVNAELIYPLCSSFNLESSLGTSLLSFGLRMVDSEESDESPVKPVTVFTDMNLNFRFGCRYYLMDNLSINMAYLLSYTRMSSWDPLRSASDSIVFGITFGF